MIIISIILLIILSIILLLLYKKAKKKLQKEFIENFQLLFNQELEKQKHKLDDEVEEYRRETLHECEEWRKAQIAERERVEQSLVERKRAVEEIIEQLEIRRREVEKSRQEAEEARQSALRARQEIIDSEKEKIDIELNSYKQLRTEQLNVVVACEYAEKQAVAAKRHDEQMVVLNNQLAAAKEEVERITSELEEYRLKQAAYNAEVLRRREVEEKQDFYRVALDENASRDIQLLLTIREKLIFRENLDKLVYDVYISKQVIEMTKRVLQGRAPSGIYKITRLKTGEIYIGKSTDIKKRWTEHCKTAYGVGTIAHSVLHTTIKKDGIENFTFELLEEVPKDKLTEREKYWITFYDSKNYGLNERNG